MGERIFLRMDGDPACAPETGVPSDALREFAISAPLRNHVSHIVAYREQIPQGAELVERVLPDGAVHLIFNLDAEKSPGTGARWSAGAAGATAAPVLLRMHGPVHGLSVTLRPGAAAALLGMPAAELEGQAVALTDVWTGEAVEVLEKISGAPDDAARIAVLQQMLAKRLQRLDGGDDMVRRQATGAAHLMAASAGRLPLREVAEAIGVGERRLQQIFRLQVGLSPRAWGRVARLHACLRALRLQPTPRWSELAADTGFYDQSHLINEFQSLCGLSPVLFLDRTVSGSSKTAA